MDIDVQGDAHKQGVFIKELYESLKSIIWVVKITGVVKKQKVTVSLTAFPVDKDGSLMTCAHGGWHSWSSREIKARRFDGTAGFEFDAELVDTKLKSDMSLLKVSTLGLKVDFHCGIFGSGKLDVGENIMVIGHPFECVGSGLTGRAVYPCTENVEYRCDDFRTCGRYISQALTTTPPYRVMGHIWNEGYFDQNKNFSLTFEKNLQANLPIIQSTGLVGGGGTSGAPMFNFQGEIVGMFVLGADGYDIGIHVTALKKYLEETFKMKREGPENSSGESVESQSTSAKKRKGEPEMRT